MGPGTDVYNRIQHGHKPVDRDDYVSMHHDIDYVGARNPLEVVIADVKAFNRYGYDSHGILGKLGMLFKATTPILSLYGIGGQPEVADELRQKVGAYH
jgi:hypothetical protein